MRPFEKSLATIEGAGAYASMSTRPGQFGCITAIWILVKGAPERPVGTDLLAFESAVFPCFGSSVFNSLCGLNFSGCFLRLVQGVVLLPGPMRGQFSAVRALRRPSLALEEQGSLGWRLTSAVACLPGTKTKVRHSASCDRSKPPVPSGHIPSTADHPRSAVFFVFVRPSVLAPFDTQWPPFEFVSGPTHPPHCEGVEPQGYL